MRGGNRLWKRCSISSRTFPKWSIKEISLQLRVDYDSVRDFIRDVTSVADGEISLEKLAVAVEIDEICINADEKGKKGLGSKRRSRGRGTYESAGLQY